jgi:hypothetical protein
MQVTADGYPMGAEFTAAHPPLIEAQVIGTSPLESVELRRGTGTVYTHELAVPRADERPLLKLTWEGARVTWRGRPTRWDGSLTLDRGAILSAEPFAFDNPEEGIVQRSERAIHWRSTTVGDLDGLFLNLDATDETELRFQTKPATFTFRLADLAQGPLVVEAGGVGQRVTASLSSSTPRPRAAHFTHRDASLAQGTHAYWLRVVQRDGTMAWSSPIYVSVGANQSQAR